MFINDLKYLDYKYKHIFHKGNAKLLDTGKNFPNNAPGLYLKPYTNDLNLVMNTFDNINEEIDISDIPINKWVNVIIRCKGRKLDVYINGTIKKSLQLSGVPKQNFGDVFVGMDGGFDGKISNLWYYDYALGSYAIQQMVHGGPNLKLLGNTGINDPKKDYISLQWYFD